MARDDAKRGWLTGWRQAHPGDAPRELLIELKIERMRRELRLHRALFGLLALAALGTGGWWVFGPADPPARVLRAHRIEVVSQEGRSAVVLDADRVGGRIALRYNRGGTPPPPAVFITAAEEGGAIQLYEPGQNYYALAFEVGPSGEGTVRVRSRDRQEGVELRGPTEGAPGGRLLLYNQEGRPAVRLGTDGAGHGFVTANGAAPN
jgi:hypothetical protein